MTEQKHAPEPMRLWRPENDEYPEPHPTDARLVGADDLCYGVLFGMVAEARAMQPRIVACVNYCAGTPTEILNCTSDRAVRAGSAAMAAERLSLMLQRDELLAALIELRDAWPQLSHGPVKLPPIKQQRAIFERVNTAIAKARDS